MATAEDVAQWMFGKLWLQGKGVLEHKIAWEGIRHEFGKEFAYEDERGHLVISQAVLEAFARSTGEDVVYSFSQKLWRWRQPGDEPRAPAGLAARVSRRELGDSAGINATNQLATQPHLVLWPYSLG